MKPFLFILFISLLSLNAAQDDWIVFSNTEANFKVEVPGEMVEKVRTIPTEIGELSYHTFIYQEKGDSSDNVLYLINYVDYPEGTMHSDSTAILGDFFKTTIETATESVDGKLAYSTDESLLDYPGKVWRILYNGGAATIKTKAFLVAQRYYAIQTVTIREKSMNNSTDRFLDSFRLLGRAFKYLES